MLNFEEMTLSDLKNLAKENNIKNISKLKKDELIIVLKQLMSSEEDTNHPKKEVNLSSDELSDDIEERQYDENGEPIIDYKLTNQGDEIVEGILDI